MDRGRNASERRIEAVREGMAVVDSAGERVGTVELVRMGDPGAETARVDADRVAAGLVGQVLDAFAVAEPDVPESLRSRLARAGYLKVDGPGLTGADRYVRADQIAGVAGDTVRLRVPKARLAAEDADGSTRAELP